ncbi:hypothetical protein L218DRAFT_838877, partial [Marasmius fiardii PR-910]
MKGITHDECKIFIAMQSMMYSLCRQAKDLKTANGRSWERFKDEIHKEWAIDIKFGSEDVLRRVIRKHKELTLGISEEEFNRYQREFRQEAKKLQEEPALLSNHTLVGLYLSAFDKEMTDKIISGLQVELASKLAK